jgi:hypothetical protein
VLAPARQRPLRAARELWWRPKRQRIAQLDRTDRRHPLDEGYVVDAMARQIEEIRNLPEVVR